MSTANDNADAPLLFIEIPPACARRSSTPMMRF
jgi:hypothetical protein